MNKTEWKEARKYYSISKILYYLSKYKLHQFKYYCFHLWYKISKYEHIHIFNSIICCSICRKSKQDIDREWLEREEINNDNKD